MQGPATQSVGAILCLVLPCEEHHAPVGGTNFMQWHDPGVMAHCFPTQAAVIVISAVPGDVSTSHASLLVTEWMHVILHALLPGQEQDHGIGRYGCCDFLVALLHGCL